MNKIDEYINSIYRDVDENSKGTQDLKQEMKSHLIQTVKELQESGITEDESIRIAIERFGEEFQIRNELNQVLEFQKLFAKKTFKASSILLMVAIIFFITAAYQFLNYRERFSTLISQTNTIEQKLVNEDISSADTFVKEIFANDKNNQLTYVAIKELPRDFDDSKKGYVNLFSLGELKYSYPEEIKSEYYRNSTGYVVTSKNVRYFLETGVKTSANRDNSSLYFGLGVLFFAVCWVLWIIWSIINVYRLGRLNTKWCILLVLTGIIGYFINIKFIKSSNAKATSSF